MCKHTSITELNSVTRMLCLNWTSFGTKAVINVHYMELEQFVIVSCVDTGFQSLIHYIELTFFKSYVQSVFDNAFQADND